MLLFTRKRCVQRLKHATIPHDAAPLLPHVQLGPYSLARSQACMAAYVGQTQATAVEPLLRISSSLRGLGLLGSAFGALVARNACNRLISELLAIEHAFACTRNVLVAVWLHVPERTRPALAPEVRNESVRQDAFNGSELVMAEGSSLRGLGALASVQAAVLRATVDLCAAGGRVRIAALHVLPGGYATAGLVRDCGKDSSLFASASTRAAMRVCGPSYERLLQLLQDGQIVGIDVRQTVKSQGYCGIYVHSANSEGDPEAAAQHSNGPAAAVSQGAVRAHEQSGAVRSAALTSPSAHPAQALQPLQLLALLVARMVCSSVRAMQGDVSAAVVRLRDTELIGAVWETLTSGWSVARRCACA